MRSRSYIHVLCVLIIWHLYVYILYLVLIFWASVIAKEASFSSVYCYCNAMPAAALWPSAYQGWLVDKKSPAPLPSLHYARRAMRTSYARQHCQSSSADIPATYVREYTTYREAETLQLAIELVLSTVKYLQRAHACTCTCIYQYLHVRTCVPRVARREGSVRAWSYVRTRYAYKYACDAYVVHAWDTRATRVRHAWDTRATRVPTRALVKLPLGGTVPCSFLSSFSHLIKNMYMYINFICFIVR